VVVVVVVGTAVVDVLVDVDVLVEVLVDVLVLVLVLVELLLVVVVVEQSIEFVTAFIPVNTNDVFIIQGVVNVFPIKGKTPDVTPPEHNCAVQLALLIVAVKLYT
jgi:hypothetical protein